MRIENLRPTQDNVVAELLLDKMSKGGIIIPETSSENEKPIRGRVVAVGPGAYDHKVGKRIPVEHRPGEEVLLRRFAGMEFESNGKRMIVLEEKHILGVIDEGRS